MKQYAVVRFLKNALLISHSEQSAASLSQLLGSEGYTEISVCQTSQEAKELANGEVLTSSASMHRLKRKTALSFQSTLPEQPVQVL